MKPLLALILLIAPLQGQVPGVISGSADTAVIPGYDWPIRAVTMQPGDYQKPSFWSKVKDHPMLWIGYTAVTVAALLDWRTTEQCVQLPGSVCGEANPILLAAGINPATKYGSRQFLAFKFGLIGGSIAGGEFLRRKHLVSERNIATVLWSAALVQGGVDAHNRMLTEKLMVPCPPAVCAP